MSPEKRYLKWRSLPDVGCMFARVMAGHPERFAQKIETISSTGTPESVAALIASTVASLVSDESVAAAALLLPEINDLERLARVALALRDHSEWSVTTTPLQNPPAGDMVAFHIVRNLPFGDGVCPSETLVLGPFGAFPATRRSPITAIEIFVGAPRPLDPKTGHPTTRANLAHMDLPQMSEDTIKNVWKKSEEGRLASLGAEDSRAKAKVSFVVPSALAQTLGCGP